MILQAPDYRNGIANLACSLLHHYGITPPNPTLPAADALLKSHPCKHVVVLLLDGMGMGALERHLAPEGFFRRHLVTPYSSTFPPTTVAATTAMASGLTPNQSGWLGWTGYFPAVDRNVLYFFNADDDTGEEITDCNVPWTYVPYENLLDRIAQTGVKTHYLAPFAPPHPKTYDAFCQEIEALCQQPEPSYTYAYWDEPDSTMHRCSVASPEAGQLLHALEERTEALASRLTDTLLIITADHGHIPTRLVSLLDYPDIRECLVRNPSIELRALNLFVKPGKENQLEAAFARHFQEDFLLMKKARVLEKQLFGPGDNHPQLNGMLGDYLAIATGDVSLVNGELPEGYLGNHAGMTAEEMNIPLMAVKR